MNPISAVIFLVFLGGAGLSYAAQMPLAVPIVLVVIPALRYLPAAYNWRVRGRINKRYRQLMALERQSLQHAIASGSGRHFRYLFL